jgi:hypothetical protein
VERPESSYRSHTAVILCPISFSRETPTRFRKELVKSIESGGVIKKDMLNQTLINIGCSDKLLTEEEYQVLLKDVGEDRALSAKEMMELF